MSAGEVTNSSRKVPKDIQFPSRGCGSDKEFFHAEVRIVFEDGSVEIVKLSAEWYELFRLCRRAIDNKTGKAKGGPVTARRVRQFRSLRAALREKQ